MKHVVKLCFFEDSATGDTGLAHEHTCRDYDGFNAFWSGIGIFHDVFEHWFEYENKYFRGDYAMNVGGEMAAMGAYSYYMEDLHLGSIRQFNSYHHHMDSMRATTESLIREAISEGYCNFGNTLECNVPNQRRTDCGEMEYQLREMYSNVKGSHFRKQPGEQYYDADAHDYSREYKKSVTLRKILNLHRYGYRLASKLVPNSYENANTLRNFISFWNEFTKNNNAEELANVFKGIDFIIYKRNNVITWKAILRSKDIFVKDVTIRQGQRPYTLDACEYYTETANY